MSQPQDPAAELSRPWCRVLVVEHSRVLWGAQIYVLRQAPLLERHGVEAILAAPADSDLARAWRATGRRHVILDRPEDRHLRDPRGRASIWRVTREMWRNVNGAWRTARLARRTGADVIDGNSHGWSHTEVALAARVSRRPALLHLHAEIEPGLLGRVRGASVRSAAAAVAVSTGVVRSLPASARPAVRVIRSGLDVTKFRPGPVDPRVHADLTDRPDAPVVLVLARLIPAKGIDDAILAVAALPEPLAQTRLAVAGVAFDPQYEAYLRELAEQRLGGRVRFLGLRTDVDDLLRACDVLVLASDTEGLGLCVLEAQACGKPTVAYPSGGITDLIEPEQTGLLAPQGDVAALSAQLARVLKEPGLADRLGQAARARVLRLHTIEAQARAHAELLAELTGRRVAIPAPPAPEPDERIVGETVPA